MSLECARVGGINLSQGVCDMEIPNIIKCSVCEAIDSGIYQYTDHIGLSFLKEPIANKMLSFDGIQCDPDKNIVVSSGATGAFYSACQALLNPGDEVIVFEPYYG